jgi:hexokinase
MESGSTQDDESMIVNTEWCNFGSSRRTLPCTWFDRKLVRESINPQFHVFEKMTTGIFLGEVVRTVLIYLVDREILFDGESSETLNSTYSFDTSYMYVCEADDSDTLEDTRIVIEDMLDISKTSLADREIVKKVCELVGVRAATLVGASLAAIVEHMVSRGIGMSEEGYSICKYNCWLHDPFFFLFFGVKGLHKIKTRCTFFPFIAISGGIYEDYPSFHPRVCTIIKELLPDDIAGRLSVGVVKHSRIVGAAIVAMMAEKNDTSY